MCLVIDRLLDDPERREDILHIALIRERQDEPSRPFRQYLKEREEAGERTSPWALQGGLL